VYKIRSLAIILFAVTLAACGASPADEPRPTAATLTPTPAPTPTPTPVPVGRFAHYRLSLSLEPDGRLVGNEVVTFPNHTGGALTEIVFRLYPNLPQYEGHMEVGPVTIDGRPATTTLRAEGTALAVALPDPLRPERSVEVELSFEVTIPHKEEGYVLFGYSQGIWSVPGGYALLAVHDGQRWHEDVAPGHGDAIFAEAALYDVSLALPQNLTLVVTGSLISQKDSDGQRVYAISGGPLREFAWLASADYKVSQTTAYGKVLRSYYLPGDEAAGQATLNIAAAALRAYQDAFGPYLYDDMIVAEAPLLHYGMEFPGLNAIGLDLYRAQRAQLEDRVVHEIAHQWWYAQVGNDQVNTPWLDEGLAEYSMAIYYEQIFGQAQANTLINQRWLVPYQVAVENDYDAVVNQPSAAFSWEYEVIVYAKAALFFDALRKELGDEVFLSVLQRYAEQYRWGIATPDDFLQVAESVSGRSLDELYDRWILTSQ